MTTSTIAIVGGTALLGSDLEEVRDAVVVLEGTQIAAAGPRSAVDIPADVDTVDASGSILIPGFIDAHVHIGFYDPAEVARGGVTTVRDLGWPPDRIWPMVRASTDPDFEGPTILAAGPMLTAPGGYPTRAPWAPAGTGREVDSPGEARAAVAEVAAEGASVVKVALNPPVGPVLSPAVLATIVDAAHERGLKVTGHVAGLDQLEVAVDEGLDELAHMVFSRRRIPSDLIRRMVDKGVAVVPTLSILDGRDLRVAVANLAAFVEAGGIVVYGTDLGNEGPKPGIDAREVEGMARAGMPARSIIASATVGAARWLGLRTKGVIAPGMDADLVALDGDDVDDIAVLTRVRTVWRLGSEL